MIVAIDGPAGAGKSSVAQRLAERLGLSLIDTGALYRCVALTASEAGIAIDDDARLAELMPELARTIRFGWRGSQPLVQIGARDVSAAIRLPDIAQAASAVSARPVVRAGLLELQRALGRGAPAPGAVLEGRDIGTVVFPEAQAKFFLTATPEVRAERRFRDLQARGVTTTLEQVLADQQRRDHDDETRALAPLRQAPDAELIDSTDLDLAAVVDRLIASLRWRSLVN